MAAGERFNVVGRDCPACARVGTLKGQLVEREVLICSECCYEFTFHGPSAHAGAYLEQLPYARPAPAGSTRCRGQNCGAILNGTSAYFCRGCELEQAEAARLARAA